MHSQSRKRVAIYARYSTDIQNDRSVDDQWAVCKAYAERQGWEWCEELLFADRARSSATLKNRPGLMVGALGAIERGEADILLAEATDRISRGMSDLPWVWEQVCVHAEASFWTLEGQIDDIRATIDGWRGSRFLKDLKQKTRRGVTGSMSRGEILAVPYGYKVAPKRDAQGNILCDENGEPVAKTGHREINDNPIPSAPDWSPRTVVIRIFREYAEGTSPRAIAAGLNRDGIPSPAGGAWYHSAFVCNRKGGMLNQRMYIGEHVYNEFRKKVNKRTDGEQRVRNPENEHISIENQAWRILPDELWEAAHKVRKTRSERATGGSTKRSGADVQPLGRKNDTLLAGRFLCSECEGAMVGIGRGRSGAGRIQCRTARLKPGCEDGCTHSKSYDVKLVETEAIALLLEYLRDPGRIRHGIEEYERTFKEVIAKAQSNRARKLKELANVEASYAHIFKLVINPELYTKDLEHELEILTHKRDTLREEAKMADAQVPKVEDPSDRDPPPSD
jgi:site-specific DNA recombinase